MERAVGGWKGWGDCYANAICSPLTHCSPGIHKHDGENEVDDDYDHEMRVGTRMASTKIKETLPTENC